MTNKVEQVINSWKTKTEEQREEIRKELQGPAVEALVDRRVNTIMENLWKSPINAARVKKS